jgi:hypothetical protein
MAAQAVDVFSNTRTVDTISHGALVPSGNERVADTKDGGCSFRASCEVPQMVGPLDDAHRFSSRNYLCYLRRLYQFRVFGTNTRNFFGTLPAGKRVETSDSNLKLRIHEQNIGKALQGNRGEQYVNA